MSRCRTRRRFRIIKRSTPSGTSLPTSRWTGWSSIQELRILRTSGSVLQVLPENFKDTWRYSAGVNYYYDEKTVLRAGVAYDQSPVNNVDRGPRLP